MGLASHMVASACDPKIASCPALYLEEDKETGGFAECVEENIEPAPRFAQFPNGTQKFGPDMAREAARSFSQEFAGAFDNFQFTPDRASSFASLFTDNFDTSFTAVLTFNETEFVLDGSPDIALKDGARIYLQGKSV